MTTPTRERHTIDTITGAHTAYSWAVRGELELMQHAVAGMTPEARAAAALGAALLAACLQQIGGAAEPEDGHVYECCGKVGRISRHETWCGMSERAAEAIADLMVADAKSRGFADPAGLDQP